MILLKICVSYILLTFACNAAVIPKNNDEHQDETKNESYGKESTRDLSNDLNLQDQHLYPSNQQEYTGDSGFGIDQETATNLYGTDTQIHQQRPTNVATPINEQTRGTKDGGYLPSTQPQNLDSPHRYSQQNQFTDQISPEYPQNTNSQQTFGHKKNYQPTSDLSYIGSGQNSLAQSFGSRPSSASSSPQGQNYPLGHNVSPHASGHREQTHYAPHGQSHFGQNTLGQQFGPIGPVQNYPTLPSSIGQTVQQSLSNVINENYYPGQNSYLHGSAGSTGQVGNYPSSNPATQVFDSFTGQYISTNYPEFGSSPQQHFNENPTINRQPPNSYNNYPGVNNPIHVGGTIPGYQNRAPFSSQIQNYPTSSPVFRNSATERENSILNNMIDLVGQLYRLSNALQSLREQ